MSEAQDVSGAPAAPPHLIVFVDETATRLRGWAFDRQAPETPVFLRFKLDGALIWEGRCSVARPDVERAGYPSPHVGFDVDPDWRGRGGLLTVESAEGQHVTFRLENQPRSEILIEGERVVGIEPELLLAEPPAASLLGASAPPEIPAAPAKVDEVEPATIVREVMRQSASPAAPRAASQPYKQKGSFWSTLFRRDRARAY